MAVTANEATTFSCGVRGLQNKQIVTEELTAAPVAGGFAGEPVQDKVLLQKVGVNVKVRRGLISGPASTSGSDEWFADIYDPVNTTETVAVGDGYLEGEYLNIAGEESKNFRVSKQSLNITDP